MKQGSIVLVPFPFTDLSSVKTRPAVVISNSALRGDDVILAGMTSRKSGMQEIEIVSDDLSEGALPLVSYIKVGRIVSLQKSIIRQVVAHISDNKQKKVIDAVCQFIKKDA